MAISHGHVTVITSLATWWFHVSTHVPARCHSVKSRRGHKDFPSTWRSDVANKLGNWELWEPSGGSNLISVTSISSIFHELTLDILNTDEYCNCASKHSEKVVSCFGFTTGLPWPEQVDNHRSIHYFWWVKTMVKNCQDLNLCESL